MAETIRVQVAYAQAETLYLRDLLLPMPATVADALAACDLRRRHPELDLAHVPVGVFGRKVKREHRLHEGDRVEIYRPLHLDPMQARRRRVRGNQGKAGS